MATGLPGPFASLKATASVTSLPPPLSSRSQDARSLANEFLKRMTGIPLSKWLKPAGSCNSLLHFNSNSSFPSNLVLHIFIIATTLLRSPILSILNQTPPPNERTMRSPRLTHLNILLLLLLKGDTKSE